MRSSRGSKLIVVVVRSNSGFSSGELNLGRQCGERIYFAVSVDFGIGCGTYGTKSWVYTVSIFLSWNPITA